jgi:hypothetical protein
MKLPYLAAGVLRADTPSPHGGAAAQVTASASPRRYKRDDLDRSKGTSDVRVINLAKNLCPSKPNAVNYWAHCDSGSDSSYICCGTTGDPKNPAPAAVYDQTHNTCTCVQPPHK